MWVKKLKKKKLQFIVIGIVLIFATAILSACLGLSLDVKKFTDEIYSKDKNSKFYLFTKENVYEELSKEFNDLDKQQGFIANDNRFTFNGEKIEVPSEYTFYVALEDYKNVSWSLNKVKEDIKSGPSSGEVWLEQIIADNFNIKIGDVIYRNNKSYIVSQLVKDSLKPNTMAGNQIIYFSMDDKNDFQGCNELEIISLNTNLNEKELNTYLEETIGSKDIYKISTLDYFKETSGLITMMVSSIGVVAALFMLIVTIVIIRFFIRSVVIQEYESIGIYKSLGFTTKEIRGFYEKCYCVVGGVSTLIGGIIGIPISIYIGNLGVEYLGEYKTTYLTGVTAIIAIIFTFLILYINVRLAFKRIDKITPVDALVVGITSTKAKLKKSIIKDAYTPLAMSINDIFKYRSKSILIVIVVFISFYVSIVFLNMCNSFDTLDDMASSWVGVPTSHCMIAKPNEVIDNDVIDFVSKSEFIEYYNVGTTTMKGESVVSTDDKVILTYAWKMSFETYNDSKYNINYAKGRPPENPKEIGIAEPILKDTKYKVGDYIKLKIFGEEDTFLITGTFNTIGSEGAVHMLNSYFEDESIYKTTIAVKLKNKSDFEKFKKEVEDKYPEYQILEINEIMGNVKDSIQAIMVPVTIIMIIIFFMFTLLNIINLIIMINKEQERNFGIMKAFGFTTGYIMKRNIYRISILSVIGVSLSIILNALVTRKIFWVAIGCDGYNMSNEYTSFLVLIGLVIIILVTIILSYRVKHVSPKKLMEE
ncbi:MAG: FtsX-like permease family protein [Clostridium sp.]